ncbi:MupA/Atu3671 family FMN-dependent luciferase-like monooxygenase [Candidatus Uabimicrobium amorphum]|uniref:Siderophore biosynthesis protein n=1 Tax=Uabimicrobium amorphum TaxID=2596890 RepID=A0A5S9IQT2_UABAM|nr:MupA/Atu3671 family FMN-dependent luciferase-like monooxygenase [Candidatus Uabimicrobium amorphum]BBM86393.1 siderophore biosynthesis protein [Candidatus Uabimicrobium amorphum]
MTNNSKQQFSILYFSSSDCDRQRNKYELFQKSAQFADRNHFCAVWMPERHFHPFGGLYPSPAILAATLATTTQKIRLRAGSVVLPLHHPVRVAEEWAVVDNLSQGRVDLSIAAGWSKSDFIFAPQNYTRRHEINLERIAKIKKLWAGEDVLFKDATGNRIPICVYPKPQQKELNVWLTCSSSVERFVDAGKHGYNILTALLFQNPQQLHSKILRYRQALRENGHQYGHVTLMLHCFVGKDEDNIRKIVRKPFCDYLKSATDLWSKESQTLREINHKDQEKMLQFAFERYFRTAAMLGTVDHCASLANDFFQAGVDEIACLIDFGIHTSVVLEHLQYINELKNHFV